MAKALPITDVAADTPFGEFAARVIEVRAGEAVDGSSTASTTGASRSAGCAPRSRCSARRCPSARGRAQGAQARLLRAGSAPRRRRGDRGAPRFEPELAAADKPGLKGLLAELEAERDASPTAPASRTPPAPPPRRPHWPPRPRPRRSAGGRRAAQGRAQAGSRCPWPPRRARRPARRRRAARAAHRRQAAALRARGGRARARRPGARRGQGRRDLQTVLGDIHDCDVLLPRLAHHRRALRAADVAAVRDGRRAPNGGRYRGVQTVDTLVRARRATCASRPPTALVRPDERWPARPRRLELARERPRPAARRRRSRCARTSPTRALYINRELSWLDFNQRVLELAEDAACRCSSA